MADDKDKTDARDRNKVTVAQGYEVRHFAESNGISLEQARWLIEMYGNDRDQLERQAEKLKQGRPKA